METEDQVLKKMETIFRRQRLSRLTKVGAITAALIILYFIGIYFYASARIAQAMEWGVFPTVEDAAIGVYSQGFGGAQVENIYHVDCGPNDPDDWRPYIRFCTATVVMDRVPKGYDRTTFLPGGFFVQLQDGWVWMPEGAFPGFVVRVMEMYHMEGL